VGKSLLWLTVDFRDRPPSRCGRRRHLLWGRPYAINGQSIHEDIKSKRVPLGKDLIATLLWPGAAERLFEIWQLNSARLEVGIPSPLTANVRGLLARAHNSASSAHLKRFYQSFEASDIQIRHLQRVLLDELASRFDCIAHQGRENVVRRYSILDTHL
jgi:hypothetical protein